MSPTALSTHPSTSWIKAGLGKAALKSAIGAALALGVLGAGQAQALTINLYNSFTFGGSTYQTYLADQAITWTTARNYAQSLGGGYNLVSINSSAENAAIFSNINNAALWTQDVNVATFFSGPWIGLFQQGQTCEPGRPDQGICGGWQWVDGTTPYGTNYTQWGLGQPNNSAGGQNKGYFQNTASQIPAPTWGDLADNSNGNIKSFVVETNVPGPLPALGAVAAFGFSRKLRKRIIDSKAVGASSTAV